MNHSTCTFDLTNVRCLVTYLKIGVVDVIRKHPRSVWWIFMGRQGRHQCAYDLGVEVVSLPMA